MIVEDFSHQDLTVLQNHEANQVKPVESLLLNNNCLNWVPAWLPDVYGSLQRLDLSSNLLETIPEEVLRLPSLKFLLLKNNRLTLSGLPKSWLCLATCLEGLNLSGNLIEQVPDSVFEELHQLRQLYLGQCGIRRLSADIGQLHRLELLYLGGNQLADVPDQLGQLQQLTCLVLSDNRLTSLPASLGRLCNLRSLSLHNNRLQILPLDIVNLRELTELSLRANPLVAKFVREGLQSWAVPSLLELAGRTVRVHDVPYQSPGQVPHMMRRYLDSAQRCVNKACCGVYFSSHVEQVKFVDFCGKYRLPLLQYLCSPRCTEFSETGVSSSSSSGSDESASSGDDAEAERYVRRVLLG